MNMSAYTHVSRERFEPAGFGAHVHLCTYIERDTCVHLIVFTYNHMSAYFGLVKYMLQ